MDEIAARVPLVYIAASRRAGLDVEALLDGLPFTEASLVERPSMRVGWDGVAVFLERAAAMAGGLEAFERHQVTELYKDADELTALAGAFISPRVFMSFYWERLAPQYFGCLETGVEPLGDELIRLSARLKPGARPCAALFHGTVGGLETMPLHLGLPRAKVVEARLGPREGVYLLTLPPSATLLARARRGAAGQLASSLLRIINVGEQPLRAAYEEQRARVAQLEAQAERLSVVVDLGRRLAACRGLRSLGDELGAIFGDRLGFGFVELRPSPLEGERFEPLARGEARGEEPECFLLESSGHLVGELRLGSPRPSAVDPARRGLLERLLPWVALAAGNARALEAALRQQQARVGGAGPRTEAEAGFEANGVGASVAALSARWGLTERQAELLGRVLRGQTTSAIAAGLGVSESAVEQQLTQLFRKAGVDSRASLLARCLGPA